MQLVEKHGAKILDEKIDPCELLHDLQQYCKCNAMPVAMFAIGKYSGCRRARHVLHCVFDLKYLPPDILMVLRYFVQCRQNVYCLLLAGF